MVKTAIKQILVIRLGSLPRVAMCVHALRGLVRDFPELRLTILTHSQWKPLFRGVEGLEFIFEDDVRYKGFVGRLRLWADVQRLKAEAIADLSATSLSRFVSFSFLPWRRKVARLKGVRLESKALTRKYRKEMVQQAPLSSRSRDLFAQLGLPFCMPAPVRRCRNAALPSIVEILAGEKHGNWVGIAPLSNHKGTCYPIPHAAELVRLLSSRYSKVFIFGKGEYQRQFCEGMQQLYPNVISTAERISLDDTLDILTILDAVVSVDGDLLRLCSLVGTPVVSLWGATHPFLESNGYGQNPENAIQKKLACRPCSRDGRHRCLFGNYECMQSITPEEVFRRVKSVTGRG